MKPADQMIFVQPDGRPAGQTMAGKNLFRHIGEQFRAGMRIGVHKNQPVAGGRRRAGISRAGDLVDRLEHDSAPAARAISAVRSVELLSQTISSNSQPRCVKAAAAVLICASDVPSSLSSLNAGTTMEIFTARNVAANVRSLKLQTG